MPLDITAVPVFVSSTWLDLGPEREAVRDAVLRMREARFVGMEYFGSRDDATRRASLDEVDRSRVYVCVVAGRYGSGITEAEYDRARQNGLPCFVYFKDGAAVPAGLRETVPEQVAKLDAFKRKLRANHLSAPGFKNPDDLAAKVTADLHRWLFDEYLTPRLQGALDGAVPRGEAQALLGAVRDLSALGRDLLERLQGAGIHVAAGRDFIGRDNITNIYNAPAPAAPAPPTLHQLRAPVGDFVGRGREIEDLSAALRGGASAAISGISGMGGIGKTELALYVAGRLRDTYPDAQLVVDMRGTDERPRDPADALASCIRAFLGLEQRLPDDVQELTRIYLSVLEGRRALILLDNASDGAQVRPLLPPAGSALLVTSRNAVTLPRMTRVTLEQLAPAEARALLRGIAPRVPEDAADRICYLCGYLPLAIRAAGSLLDVTADLAPEAYAQQLQDERRRLELIGAEGVDISVEASFNLSYARLSPDAARVFRQLSVFPATFDARAEEAVCEDPGHKHLSELLRRNLVLYNPDTRRYRLHDLARLFADSRLSDEDRRAGQARHAAHYLMVLGQCDDFYLQGGELVKNGLALFDAERRNIETGQGWACEHVCEGEPAAGLCAKYSLNGSYVLGLRQYPRERIRWLEASLEAARQVGDRGAEGGTLNYLGHAYASLGETRRAIECVEQCLAIVRGIGDRQGEGSAVGNLGYLYDDLGEYRRAIELYEESLAINREIGDRRNEGKVLTLIGVAFGKLGDMQRALEFNERGLAVAREIGDLQSEGDALGNMANVFALLGETQRAIELQQQHLVIAREIGERMGEGIGLYNLSLAFRKLGDGARAFEFAEAALEIFEQIESPLAEKVRAQLARWRAEATGEG